MKPIEGNAQDKEQTLEDTGQEAPKPLFVEDLEERRNASGPVTTLAIGEEQGFGCLW
jgi:hypothetical protein